ncbi:MAG: hypothetical protein ACM33T_06340 [Solirubrobacterales bacterium]
MVRTQPPEVRAWRARQGWPRTATLMGLGGACQRIHAHRVSQLYTPDDTGPLAAILVPVWSGPAPGRPEDLVDLLAWVPSTGDLLTRWGLADVLGLEAVYQAGPCMGVNRPLRVFRDPGAWARAAVWDGPEGRGAHGVVVINWAGVAAALGHLVGMVDFIADDLATARRLRDALMPRPAEAARILVTSEGVAA